MKLIAIEEKVLQDILNKLEAIEEKASSQSENPQDKWIDNQEFCQLLNISKRTAQNYRDQGMIEFSQPGSKVYYKLSAVHAMLEKYTNKAFK